MAGGLGTRLWPWSRYHRPKQFLPLLGDQSLIRATWDRLIPLASAERMMVFTNAHLTVCAESELPELDRSRLFGEPCSCNTAPCVALASALCERFWGPEAVMAVLSADHYIGDVEGFRQAMRGAVQVAVEMDCLVTLGIPPTRPEIGYGYLECDCPVESIPEGQSTRLKSFREKPDYPTAQKYLGDGRHLWNMGNFVWRVGVILSEFEKNMPELLAAARRTASHPEPHSAQAMESFFLNIPPEWRLSIDYGIMEHAEHIRVIPCRIPWDDVGSWSVLRRLRKDELDTRGNLSLIRHLAIDTTHTVVAGEDTDKGIIVTLGVDGLTIIRDGEMVLVAGEEGLAHMREVVTKIKELGWEHLL